jgi:trehalose 6-phosphate phosphatase
VSVAYWRDAKDQLAKLAAKPRFGLFSDLDGTLSPIADTPSGAKITPRSRELLEEFQKELPVVALISGRRADNLRESVGIDGIVYIGNHGLERWINGKVQVMPEVEPYMKAVRAMKIDLQGIDEPGVHVEDKGPILSLHYRQATKPIAFARNNAAMIAEMVEKRGLTLFTGKMVFEVRPPVDMDKGVAVLNLVSEWGLEAALYIGDDMSDLNALKMARKLREEKICDAWGVGVQSLDAPEALATTADFLARDVDDVGDLLTWLLKARRASST